MVYQLQVIFTQTEVSVDTLRWLLFARIENIAYWVRASAKLPFRQIILSINILLPKTFIIYLPSVCDVQGIYQSILIEPSVDTLQNWV